MYRFPAKMSSLRTGPWQISAFNLWNSWQFHFFIGTSYHPWNGMSSEVRNLPKSTECISTITCWISWQFFPLIQEEFLGVKLRKTSKSQIQILESKDGDFEVMSHVPWLPSALPLLPRPRPHNRVRLAPIISINQMEVFRHLEDEMSFSGRGWCSFSRVGTQKKHTK